MRFVFRNHDEERLRVRIPVPGDEARTIGKLLGEAELAETDRQEIADLARELVVRVRAQRRDSGGIDAFMREYDLSSEEGVAIMCLAEALLRIPDAETADRLIRDKIGKADWQRHLGEGESLFVNATTWGLMLTGRIVRLDPAWSRDAPGFLGRMVNRMGEPVIREAMTYAMRIVGRQFVIGATIEKAVENARSAEALGYRHSFDMLGEAACTMADADRYLAAYDHAIGHVGGTADANDPIAAPGVSVKLSALHPRYERAQHERVVAELAPRFVALAARARDFGIGLTMDAEEARRLDLSLDVFALAARASELAGWNGLGLAVQAYQLRATGVIEWLDRLAQHTGRRFPVRLVKGAYWDTEIKHAQEQGLAAYQVFTRKTATDVSYVACARRLLARPESFYPQFATHNAQTLATLVVLSERVDSDCEFQCLYGMGRALYQELVETQEQRVPCRVYAPVGHHADLLPYLVRRLLENGANTSFVNRILDDARPIGTLVRDPVDALRSAGAGSHPEIPLPARLFGPQRRNSEGLDVNDVQVLAELAAGMKAATDAMPWTAHPACSGGDGRGRKRTVFSPADRRRTVGRVYEASAADIEGALGSARGAAAAWTSVPATQRAACLERLGDLLEENRARAMAIATLEAGKTLGDGLAEVREATDFCRYYAQRAREDFAEPVDLPGPTGETNRIALHGRGAFVCISPWNFPLAIFCGQVAAALAAGNAVLAKPAEQTPLMAAFAVGLAHEAGIPKAVLQLLPGGAKTGAALVGDPRIDGVAFTGSTETGRLINRALAARDAPLAPLIAETGGQNAMIVDSTALPEQVIADVIRSAFGSAGQRCSAMRILCLQAEIAERVIDMLAGAMDELRIGDPALLETDVGPLIDEDARSAVERHVARMPRVLHRCRLDDDAVGAGTFVAPTAVEIDAPTDLDREVFGPVVHVLRYPGNRLDELVDAINATGYGLTLGVHTRIDSVARRVADRARAGNIYVNRNMIGAIVGSQPFGGEGLSGTGPKAGGPRYLHRFATERVVSTDTTAAGGNASLMTLGDA